MNDQGIRKLTPSVARDLPLAQKLSEGWYYFREYRQRGLSGHNFETLFANIDEYDAFLREHAGIALCDGQILEIGFGAKPYRQMILHSMNVDASGVDAEMPMLSGHPTELFTIIKQNGIERAAKSMLRHIFFDGSERGALSSAIRQRGFTPRLDTSRLIVEDAGDLEIQPSSLDLIFSEDVFEHIERVTLDRLVPRMAEWLRPHGLALIRPNVFTGIVGGHLLEWRSLERGEEPLDQRRSNPWEHLRRRRFAPNTYLNEMTRAEYRELFGRSFEILEERVTQPDLGREYLDEGTRRDLSGWSEDELFSNQTLFVLRPREQLNVAPNL
jgi:hypothetical protein